MFEKQLQLAELTREEMAYELAPMLKRAVGAGGPYTTLLDAHRALADPKNKLDVTVPAIGPEGVAAGVIIIIAS